MADKPGRLFVFAVCQMLVVLAKFSDELLQLLALGMLLHLHNPSVRTIEVRIPPAKTTLILDKRRLLFAHLYDIVQLKKLFMVLISW